LRRSLSVNISAALRGRQADSATSGITSLSPSGDGGDSAESAKTKNRWGNLLDNKPDLSRLKSGAQDIRDRIRRTGGAASRSGDPEKDPKG